MKIYTVPNIYTEQYRMTLKLFLIFNWRKALGY